MVVWECVDNINNMDWGLLLVGFGRSQVDMSIVTMTTMNAVKYTRNGGHCECLWQAVIQNVIATYVVD